MSRRQKITHDVIPTSSNPINISQTEIIPPPPSTQAPAPIQTAMLNSHSSSLLETPNSEKRLGEQSQKAYQSALRKVKGFLQSVPEYKRFYDEKADRIIVPMPEEVIIAFFESVADEGNARKRKIEETGQQVHPKRTKPFRESTMGLYHSALIQLYDSAGCRDKFPEEWWKIFFREYKREFNERKMEEEAANQNREFDVAYMLEMEAKVKDIEDQNAQLQESIHQFQVDVIDTTKALLETIPQLIAEKVIEKLKEVPAPTGKNSSSNPSIPLNDLKEAFVGIENVITARFKELEANHQRGIVPGSGRTSLSLTETTTLANPTQHAFQEVTLLGGHKISTPKNFEIPRGTVMQMWELWNYGSEEQQVCAYRALIPKLDIPQRQDRFYFAKLKKVFDFIEKEILASQGQPINYRVCSKQVAYNKFFDGFISAMQRAEKTNKVVDENYRRRLLGLSLASVYNTFFVLSNKISDKELAI